MADTLQSVVTAVNVVPFPPTMCVGAIIQVGIQMYKFHEDKCQGDTNVTILNSLVQQICEMLKDKFLDRPNIQEKLFDQLKKVQMDVQAAQVWCVKYGKRSAFSKFFTGAKNNRETDKLERLLRDALHLLNTKLNLLVGQKLDDVHAAIMATPPNAVPAPPTSPGPTFLPTPPAPPFSLTPAPGAFQFDLGELGVEPNVQIKLASYAKRAASLRRHEEFYELRGPEEVTSLLREVMPSGAGIIGQMATAAPVNLDEVSRVRAGIPLNASWFAHVYPPIDAGKLGEARIAEIAEKGLAKPLLHFILLGGFAYFDADGSILALNCLTQPPDSGVGGAEGLCSSFGGPKFGEAPAGTTQRSSLSFTSAKPMPEEVTTRLAREGMQPMTLPVLKALGVNKYIWLNPDADWPYGAFVYQAHEAAGQTQPPTIYFPVALSSECRDQRSSTSLWS